MAAAECVGTAKGNHLLIIKAHAAKDGANMVLLLGGVWKAAIGCAEGEVSVGTAWSPWDDWALHLIGIVR